jgi:hypothetical protein
MKKPPTFSVLAVDIPFETPLTAILAKPVPARNEERPVYMAVVLAAPVAEIRAALPPAVIALTSVSLLVASGVAVPIDMLVPLSKICELPTVVAAVNLDT